jgi:hypothetical protein
MSWFDFSTWSWPWSKPAAPAAPVVAEAPLPPPSTEENSGTTPALTGARRRKSKTKRSKKAKSKRSRTGRKSNHL